MDLTPPQSLATLAQAQSVYVLLVGVESQPGSISFITHCILEGLIELGIPFNLNSIPELTVGHVHPLNLHERVTPDLTLTDADLILVDTSDLNRHIDQLLDVSQIFQTWNLDPQKTYYLTNADNAPQLIATGSESIIAVHESSIFPSIGDRYAWGFGISNYQIEIAQHADVDAIPFSARWDTVLRNFRPSFSQSVRAVLDLALIPLLTPHFAIDTDIYTEDGSNHYERLACYKFCLGYCGDLRQRVTDYHYFQEVWADNPLLIDFHARAREMAYIIRWDSWRFWESLLFGSVTISLNCERYGFKLPVTPVNWQHYIGLELDNIPATVERILDEPNTLAAISIQGRQWALEHYSPKACATRLLTLAATRERDI